MEKLLNKLRIHDIDVNVVDDKLVINVPEGFLKTDIIEEVKEKKAELIDYIKERKKVKSKLNPLLKSAPKAYYKLTPPQRRLYFLQELSKGSTAYNLTQAYRIEGVINKELLEGCFKELITRHEGLRTRFEIQGHEVVQRIEGAVFFKMAYYDVSKEPLESIIKNFVRSFDLSECPLLRVCLIGLSKDEHLLLIDMHHIISDGTSQQLLLKDFSCLYNGQELSPLKFHYSDYAEWYHSDSTQASIQDQKSFWQNEFSGLIPHVELPTDFSRPQEKTFAGSTFRFSLNKEQSRVLQGMADKGGYSLFTVLLSLYSIWLSKLSGQKEVVIGTPTAGRKDSDLQNMLGMFVNTLALKLHADSSRSFKDYLGDVHLKTLSCFDNQDFPYEELIDDLQISRDLSHNPLFDFLFVFQNIYKEEVSLNGLSVSLYNTAQKTSKFDLCLVASQSDSCLEFVIEYSTELFKSERIADFGSYFKNIAESVIGNEEILLGSLSLLSVEESTRLLSLNDHSSVDYPRSLTLVGAFEQQVLLSPSSIAIAEGSSSMSYEALNKRVNRLAHYLREEGVVREELVGLLMSKSTELIVCMLAVLKAGGAYVPLDVDYPQSRLDYLIGDSKIGFLIRDKSAPEITGTVRLISIEEVESAFSSNKTEKGNKTEEGNKREENLIPVNQPGDLCYVIYTSGTTGNPKGVLIEHGNVVRLLFNNSFRFDVGKNDVWSMFHSHCFDFSVWEMYGALLYGGKLVLISKQQAMDPGLFIELIKDHKVSVLNQTPTAFYNLIHEDLKSAERLSSLRYVIFGGEALTPSKLKSWHAAYPGVKLVNMFGTTETTVHASYKEIGSNEISENISNIGTAIPTLSLYVLDKEMNAVPQGVTGELYIGGSGVGRGYLGRDALTAERFVSNPYRMNDVLYRTGDLSRLLPSGEIEYLGREDFQVKIRGHRIELGEIEYHLLAHGSITNATVLVRSEGDQKQLCCYVVSSESLSPEDLRQYLSSRVPSYMVPSYFMQIDSLPLTSNSKVDVSKLPSFQVSAELSYVAPATATEKFISEVWSGVLSVERVGIRDNYFSLGGDSLKAIGLIYELNKGLPVKLSIADLYSNQTVEKLSMLVQTKSGDAGSTISDDDLQAAAAVLKNFSREYKNSHGDVSSYESIFPMNGVEKGMVFHSLKKGSPKNIHEIMYHEQNIYSIPYVDFSFDLFKRAVKLLVVKHGELRKIYDLESLAHLIVKEIDPLIAYIDLSDLSAADQKQFLEKKMEEEKLRATDLSMSVLWRMSILKINPGFHYLLFDMHHSLFDGWSLSSFITELNNVYVELKKDSSYIPTKLRSNYGDQILGELAVSLRPASIAYWQNELSGYNRLRFVPTGLDHQYITQRITMDPGLRKELEALAVKCESSFKHVCFAAYAYTMRMFSYSNDIVVGLVANNRPLVADSEQLLGCFLNTIPVRIVVDGNNSWMSYIRMIEDKLRELKKHEQVPLFDILRMINDRTDAGNALYDTAFNYIDFRVFKDAILEDHSEDTTTAEFKLENYVNINTLLNLSVHGHDNSFQVVLTYSTTIVEEVMADQIIRYFLNTLSQFLNNVNGSIRNEIGKAAILELPTDYVRTETVSKSSDIVQYKPGKKLINKLNLLCKQEEVTMHVLLLAAFNVLLYKYSGQENIAVTTPIAEDALSNLSEPIDFSTNTVIIQNEVRGDMNFRDFLSGIKSSTRYAYEHQAVPLETMVRADKSWNSLFQIMFAVNNTPFKKELPPSDLILMVNEHPECFSFQLEYRADLFNNDRIERMAGHYESILNSIVENTGSNLHNLSMLSASEEHQLVQEFNNTAAPYSHDKTPVDLFQAQVKKTPDNIAVIFKNKQYTYQELDERSNQLARYLKELGIKKESLVPICIERSIEMIVGIWGILKAGGAYVPVAPEYPEERINFILEDTGATLLLSSDQVLKQLSFLSGKVNVIDIALNNTSIYNLSAKKINSAVKSHNLMYVIYTSGSTGKPKGVMVEYGGIMNRIAWMWNQYGFTESDVILQKTSFTFDVSVWELFMPLCYGAKMVLCPKEDTGSADRLCALIEREHITCLHFVPSMLSALISSSFEDAHTVEKLKSLTKVITSGEALPLDIVRKWYHKLKTPIHNLYGPTEASVDVTHYSTSPLDTKIPIGAPIWNTSMYILNIDGQLSPIGVKGELYIAGVGVARGYLNRPELTKEKFINNPFIKGERMYKTGDLASWLPDGNIEFFGRKDDQVKIRGYRIELGEIENALFSIAGIKSCCVLAKDDAEGNKRLVGYVVKETGLDKAHIESVLELRLPEYMVPRLWVELEIMPLNNSGKTDRKNLPDPEVLTLLSKKYVAPRTKKEKQLAEIWIDLLKVERVGIHDNFFELGGHSLLATRLVSMVSGKLNEELTIKDVFDSPTIEEMAIFINYNAKKTEKNYKTIVKI